MGSGTFIPPLPPVYEVTSQGVIPVKAGAIGNYLTTFINEYTNCSYCNSNYLHKEKNCPNCGAPKA